MTRIPFLTPRLPDASLLARDLEEIWTAGVFTNGGPFERRFADEIAHWIGGDVTVAVTANATSGIQLACRELFHPGRRYALVASFTAVAGPLALRWAGYEPLLIDIEHATWQPDANAAEKALEQEGDDIAGILLTNTFGTANASIDRWERLAKRFGQPLVIDSAPGLASRYPWAEPLGARGDCEVFSFHATKTVAIGEGGAVASRDHGLIERIDRLKNFGFDDERLSLDTGLNAKLPEISSAIGLRQLAILTDRLYRRRELLSCYAADLEAIGCEFQQGVLLSAPPFVSVVLPSGEDRGNVGGALNAAGIGWRCYYNPPIHRQPSFAGTRSVGELVVTDDIARRIVSLPLDEQLSPSDIARITAVVGDAIA